MSEKFLQELVASPFGLEKIDILDGYPIYSSEQLKEKFNTAIQTLRELRPCLNRVISLVKDGKIVPCVSYSGLLSYIVKKTISHKKDMMFQGAYVLNKDIIYIVADMKFADFLKVDKNMALILLHELMHYCSRHRPTQFFRIFEDQYELFFMSLFERYFNADIDKKVAKDISKYATRNFELDKDPDFVKYSRFLDETIPDNAFKGKVSKTEAISRYISPINALYKRPDRFIRLLRSDKEVQRLVRSMYRVYMRDFRIKDPDTTPIQELIYPSEIPAVTSTNPSNLHYTAINRLT